MPIPVDYAERVYAGVLGKLIGVYLGRPFEGWQHKDILAKLGEVWGYVNDRTDVNLNNRLLVVTDDDISGTFTFLRALEDYGPTPTLTPAQIGQTWLNYIVEQRTTLWWGGLGNSTEHTAYLRLKAGKPAPASGASATNGRVTAEQIGAQIFIDGWAMAAPGDPALAADLARRAASVSHDGEAINAAQLLAALEAMAFVEADTDRLLDAGLTFIPRDCVIARLVGDLREWHASVPEWRTTRARIADRYGYDRYPGNCHVVPNHALIHLGLLYGDDDFQKSLMIVNTSGWDSDCNSGNLGCLMGIKLGLRGLETGYDWRGPVADRLYLPSADGGRAVTDAVSESYRIINLGRALAGEPSLAPKQGARYHFSLPGSVQGFRAEDPSALSIENAGPRGLALRCHGPGRGSAARAGTATFIPPEAVNMPGYGLMASPSLYPGQVVRAALMADPSNAGPITAGLYLRYYGADDTLVTVAGPTLWLAPGSRDEVGWKLGDTDGAPIAEIGVALSPEEAAEATVYLDWLTWDGTPEAVFKRSVWGGTLWRRAWVDAVDHWDSQYPEAFRLVQNRNTGMLIMGTREWTDYTVSALIEPRLLAAGGLAARVQGLRRYYALLLFDDGFVRLVRALDGETVLAEAAYSFAWGEAHQFTLQAAGTRLRAGLDGRWLFDVDDAESRLASGGIALICTEGCLATALVSVRP